MVLSFLISCIVIWVNVTGHNLVSENSEQAILDILSLSHTFPDGKVLLEIYEGNDWCM